MIVVISPAKKLNLSPEIKSEKGSTPYFLNKSGDLMQILKKLSIDQIKNLMKVSDNIANLNFDRYKTLTTSGEELKNNSYIAILTFAGEVYNGLDANSFSNTELEFANQNLRILSGLYGVLKPLDRIQPYRLEMGTKLTNNAGNNLYKFWQSDLTDYFNKINSNFIINLASTEYFSALNEKNLKADIITPIFKDYKNGSYKVIMMYAKKARGLMAKHIIKNKITDWRQLQNFNVEKYKFNSKMSEIDGKDKKLVFTREL